MILACLCSSSVPWHRCLSAEHLKSKSVHCQGQTTLANADTGVVPGTWTPVTSSAPADTFTTYHCRLFFTKCLLMPPVDSEANNGHSCVALDFSSLIISMGKNHWHQLPNIDDICPISSTKRECVLSVAKADFSYPQRPCTRSKTRS